MKAYSTDLREKIALAYETNDYTLDEVADLFGVGRRSVTRFVHKHRAGFSLAPQPHAGGYPARLSATALSVLSQKVAETPDATLAELVSYLKVKADAQVHLSTVCRALQRLGLPRKKRRWPRPKEMSNHVSPCARGCKQLIGASSSLLMKQAFIWLSRVPLAVRHEARGSSAQCPSTEGAITL
ncbi:MAG TPA: transposase [Pyrinomonadaceae bacterium]|jgi:putative transposase|nr:transposase [Pyrinomonadaceae bacterium]